MKNKILTQEWNLIKELLERVNTKEEYEYLVARANEICSGQLTSETREKSEHLRYSSFLKGGSKKMEFHNEALDKATLKRLQDCGIWLSRNAPPMNKDKALVLMGEVMLDRFVKEFVRLWKDELFPHCLLRDYQAPAEEIREMLGIEKEQKEENREGENPSLVFLSYSISLKGGNACSAVEKMTNILTIKDRPIMAIYESFDGSYWYIVEKLYRQDSIIGGKVYQDDQILYGYARLSMCPEFAEFGTISETEIKLLGNRIWKVPKRNWRLCPEVEDREVDEVTEGEIPSVPGHLSSISLKGGNVKMQIETQTTIDRYVELLEKIRERTESSPDSLAILAEIRKDQRMQQIQQKTVMNSNMPATENQIGYLKKLGAKIPEGLTRQEASTLIDDRKEEIAMQKAVEQPMRIP